MKSLTIILITTIFSLNVIETAKNKTQKFVPAIIQNGKVMPVINLPIVDITANPQPPKTGYHLPEVTITAPKQNVNMMPAVKWNGVYIATSQLSQVDVTAKKKKTLLASFFRFNWLFKR